MNKKIVIKPCSSFNISAYLPLFLIASLCFCVSAFAQTPDLPTYEQIQAAAGSSGGGSADTSRAILSKLLGPFADNPFTPGAANTLLGSIFFYFNAVLFVVGAAFIGYNTMMAVAVTAHEGEALGKKMSGLWVPIRFTTGIFGMVPVFSGFSMAQAVMMIFVTLGIGMANLMTTQAITFLDDFQSIIPTPINTVSDTNRAASQQVLDQLFFMHVCTQASADYDDWVSRNISQKISKPQIKNTPDGTISSGNGLECGNVKIIDTVRTNSGYTQSLKNYVGIGGYRNTAVDYEKINSIHDPILKSITSTLHSMSDSVKDVALTWYTGARGDKDNATFPDYPASELNNILSSAISTEDAAMQAAFQLAPTNGSITSTAKENMSKGGWIGIGAWYATFAEANAALQTAATTVSVSVDTPKTYKAELPKSLADIFSQMNIKKRDSWLRTCNDRGMQTPTGSCSPGQSLIMVVLNSAALGTGGGSGDSALVNPIFVSKNVGDTLLNIAGVLWLIKQTLPDNAGKAADVALSAVSAVPGGAALKVLGKALSAILALPFLALGAMFILGLMFAVYIPFIPFLTWFSGLVTYFASVIEGLVAAQVWAFSHLHTEGEGMGPQTGRGYLYMLNMLLRPGLMVLGFFFASAIVVLLGTLFFQMFATALANVQGDTMTGVIIQFGVLCIVMITLLGLVQSTFNLIFEVPDRVMSWFGSGMDARIGREMSAEIKAEKKSATQWVGRTADTTARIDK